MASRLPVVPRVVFTIIEPVSLICGFVGAVWDPVWFTAEQLPHHAHPMAVSQNGVVVAQQLGNMYLLMCFVGLAVLMTTSEIKVVKAYLVALWLGDIGHLIITCLALGKDRMMQPFGWNAVTWGNIGLTSFVFLMRSTYLLGLFGDGSSSSSRSRATSSTAKTPVRKPAKKRA